MIERIRQAGLAVFGPALSLFVLAEVNYPVLQPQSELAIFAALGLILVFVAPVEPGRPSSRASGLATRLSAAASLLVGLYIVVQTEPLFADWWLDGRNLGERAGLETPLDLAVGLVGLVLVLAGAWRAVGAPLPLLSIVFLAYGYWGRLLPDWLMPHRGYDLDRLVSQTFLHSQGVFGVALSVMFTYVFLFVLFGAVLEASGATEFIISASRRALRRAVGGPAKVAVISSGMMGSLSGSAVANTASTGTFTIPMMKSAGLSSKVAAGLEAAASSGGALVPPVMGAGAYMMLEIIVPPVTYLEIIRAALIPAILYYLSLYLIVHFYGHRTKATMVSLEHPDTSLVRWEGIVFVGGLGSLVVLLVMGFTVFRAVSVATFVVIALAAFEKRTRLSFGGMWRALEISASNGVVLIAAAASVGIVIGVVTLTGIGTRLPALLLPLAEESLLLTLGILMVSSIILGMGLPSAVCYLLMATLVGPVLGRLGVVPLAAHLFIFYFGMMSMVTPPVALAAYAASSISGSKIIETSVAAFRFALIGFALPFVFVFRPQLLMLAPDGGPAAVSAVLVSTLLAAAGTVALAVAIVGYVRAPVGFATRAGFLLAAVLLLLPAGPEVVSTATPFQLAGGAWLGLLWFVRARRLHPAD